MATNTDRLALRPFTESDNWSAIVDKLNFNFDMVKAYGGGDIGDPGKLGNRGLPGATGIGKPGNQGAKGATIRFLQVALTDGEAVSDATLRVGDVVIDSNGSFFTIIENNLGNPVFKFEYSLASAIAGSIVETENTVFSQSTNPIIKWVLRNTGNPRDANALFVDRVVGTVTDEAQMYRVVIGDSGYPLLQNAALVLVNILPNDTDISAKNNFFAQLAFKYRSTFNSNVSSNTGYLRYLELNKNETTPAGTDDTYMTLENVSAGFGAVHDSATTDASYALIRGKTTRFMGKQSLLSLYNNGSLNNSYQYMDVIVDTDRVSLSATTRINLVSSANAVTIKAAINFSVDAPKNYFKGAIYIGTANYIDAANYAPVDGGVIQGALGIGYTAAPTLPASMNALLSVNGDIYMVGRALAFGGTDTNLEHIWVDDDNIAGSSGTTPGTFHLVADAGYKTVGNAGLRISRLWASQRVDAVLGVSIGPEGWRDGPNDGSLSVYGQGYFRTETFVDGKFWARADAIFNGVVGMETTNFYTRVGSQVDFRQGDSLYVGAPGINYSMWRYWNTATGNYDWLGYRGDMNRWRLSYGGLERDLWHSGFQGAGTGMDSDLVDGYHASGFVRFNERSDGDYVWIRGTNATGAVMVTQQNPGGGGPIMRWLSGSNDGSSKAYVDNNGTFVGNDFFITSDKKLKKNIKNIAVETGVDIIRKLRPVTFNWKDSSINDGKTKVGFIANEVAEILPNSVIKSDQNDGALTMNNTDIIPYLVSALQNALKRIEDLEKKLK